MCMFMLMNFMIEGLIIRQRRCEVVLVSNDKSVGRSIMRS